MVYSPSRLSSSVTATPGLIQQIKKKILKSKNLLQIADELEENPKDIEFLYECVKDHSDKENEEIYKIYITADKKKD